MEIRQLKYFIRIAELESITKAAEVLLIAQPALSMQMRSLEEELGVQLLIRHSRGVRTTEAGQVFLERAIRILHDIDLAKRSTSDMRLPSAGPVRLGINPSIDADVVAGILQTASRVMPDLSICVLEGSSNHLIKWVLDGTLHLAVVFFVPDGVDGIVLDRLAHDGLVFVSRFASAQPASIRFDQAMNVPLVLQPRSHKLRAMVEGAAAAMGRQPLVPFEIESVSIVVDLVERGLAASILPESAVKRALADRRVTASRIVEPELGLDLSLAYLESREWTPQEILLRRLIRQIVTAPGGTDFDTADTLPPDRRIHTSRPK